MTTVKTDYFVMAAGHMEPFRVEKSFDTGEKALAYLQEYGERDYQCIYHGERMKAVEIKIITTEKVLGTN